MVSALVELDKPEPRATFTADQPGDPGQVTL